MKDILSLLVKPFFETLYMVGFATLLTVIIGLPLGTILVITSSNHIAPLKKVNLILSYIVNVIRSFPFIILMIVIFPLTKFIVGTRLGATAAIVPLTFSAVPFFARLVETSLKEIPKGVIEATQSMGASTFEIITRVMIPEALSSIILGITTTIINIIGYSAMAGSIGAGGLGNLAITYGYMRWETDVMIITVIVLIILVQAVQTVGSYISNLFDKKNNKKTTRLFG